MQYDADRDDELDDFDQRIVGHVVRVHIPLRSPSALYQVADLLRGLANECERAAGGHGNARSRLFELRAYARQVDIRMKSLRGRGRPPKLLR